jgi:hypothetical protein
MRYEMRAIYALRLVTAAWLSSNVSRHMPAR